MSSTTQQAKPAAKCDSSTDTEYVEETWSPSAAIRNLRIVAGVLGALCAAFLVATILLVVGSKSAAPTSATNNNAFVVVDYDIPTTKPVYGENVCKGAKLELPNVKCVIDEIDRLADGGKYATGEQSGTNVTKGYTGDRPTDAVPITVPYWQAGLCPVNVHWHLGTEHLSVGEYDETGVGPVDDSIHSDLGGSDADEGALESARMGFQCKYYNEKDPKFTKPYQWKHCVDMQVGQTYEVHWPHSALGACGTPNQYQTPFYDGVFCNADLLTSTSAQIGVQAQVFTVVNDESYYYPDLFRGMVVDGEMGQDIAKYTGSTTGDKRNNEICSSYAPITWQVDRKCHMISASSFDKMCADMKAQRDDMSGDLHPHGSRELVADEHAANNHQDRRKRNLRSA